MSKERFKKKGPLQIYLKSLTLVHCSCKILLKKLKTTLLTIIIQIRVVSPKLSTFSSVTPIVFKVCNCYNAGFLAH